MCYVRVTYVWRMKCTRDVSTAYVLRSILIYSVSVLYQLLFNTYENKRLCSLCSCNSHIIVIKYEPPHGKKTTICIGKNKGADQLRINCGADQCLCFFYVDSTIPLLYQGRRRRSGRSGHGRTTFLAENGFGRTIIFDYSAENVLTFSNFFEV